RVPAPISRRSAFPIVSSRTVSPWPAAWCTTTEGRSSAMRRKAACLRSASAFLCTDSIPSRERFEGVGVDFGTLIGLLAGLTLVTIAILLGESPTAFWNVPSLCIVLGGTLAATFIKFPLPALVGTIDVVRQAFQRPAQKPEELVALLVRMAQEVRRDSLLALERIPVSDPFLKRGVSLAADGAEPAL